MKFLLPKESMTKTYESFDGLKYTASDKKSSIVKSVPTTPAKFPELSFTGNVTLIKTPVNDVTRLR